MIQATGINIQSYLLTYVKCPKTLSSSIGPVVKSLFDIAVKVCVAILQINIYDKFFTFFHHRYSSFLAFERSAALIFLPPSPWFCPHTTSKVLVL